jgi:hypothetical protein
MTRNADLLLAIPPGRSRSRSRSRPPGELLPATRQIVAAIRDGRAGGMFPPVVVDCPEGVPKVVRGLSGPADADRMAWTLAQPGFQPLQELVEALDAWSRLMIRRHAALLAPRVLAITSGDLHGPLVSDAFTACAAWAAARGDVRPTLQALLDGFRASFTLFLDRLARDLRAGVFRDDGVRPPVVRLCAHREETHNGRQSVLQLRFRAGGSWAYKPRPAGGERLFLCEGNGRAAASLFELINQLPAASGQVRLPTMRVRRGTGPDRFAYGWHEWIERPRQWGTVRRSRRLHLEACRLSPREAATFWHRAGSLSAACFAFGVADLYTGNLLVGARPRDGREPLPYPVDLEVFFYPLRGLADTGLVADADDRGNHHVGFERLARWCTVGGPPACFVEAPGGRLLLVRRTRPWGREEARSVVADSRGRVGYGPHLLSYLRGMFDLWTLLVVERKRIVSFVERASRQTFVRVLVKATAHYAEELDRQLLAAPPGWTAAPSPGAARIRYSAEERRQLARFDVPYFFRLARGGPLLALDPPPGAARRRRAGRQQVLEPGLPPDARVRRGGQIELIQLGAAIRDAIDYVLADVRRRSDEDARLGVRVELEGRERGQVSFDWVELGQRLTWSWEPGRIRLDAVPLARDPSEPTEPTRPVDRSLRRHLLRIDRIDRALRSRWVKTEFADRALERELDRLVAAAVDWLDGVISTHGWPGRSLVGPRAADAACRLVQHAGRHAGFQRRCLRAVRDAAARGEIPLRHVAYLTDAVRVGAGRKQLFGTKFRKHRGELVPYPIEKTSEVDRRRRDMELEPLATYAARLRRTFLSGETAER